MKSYHFDDDKKAYTVFSKDGSEVTVSEEGHRKLLIDYTVRKWPIQKICLHNKISVAHFEEYRRAFGITRDSLPISDEELLNNSDTKDLGLKLLERVEGVMSTAKDLEHAHLQETSKKWSEFESGILRPFEQALDCWAPPQISLPDAPPPTKNNRWFCAGFSDWHIGSEAEGRYLFRQNEDWNADSAKAAIKRLVEKIKIDVQNDKAGYEGCVILLGGDMLHGPEGCTAKGTVVDTGTREEAQFDALLEILYETIASFSDVFEKVVVHTVRGNHEGLHHYSTMLALNNYFRAEERIEINIHSTRTAAFQIANTMILLDHGSSDLYKRAHVPKAGTPRESYIQSLLLSQADLYNRSNGCIFIQGDKHHYEQTEYNDFEFIMMGALPVGDRYADNHNWNSRPRQNCFVVDENGLKSVSHYYID